MHKRAGLPPEFKKLKGIVLSGRYVVEQCVGVGGMAVVFRGRHATLDRSVAIKVLRPEYQAHDEVVGRFDREARAASHFDHPNCIQVFDVGVTPDGFKFMVMPFLEGRELAKVLDFRLPPTQAIALTTQILHGLEYAHRRGVVHRDLKPDNVFIMRDHEGNETLKVVDFGIAKIVDDKPGVDGIRTKVGAIVGTPAYMSPEQAMGAEVDARADLYSVGVMLYRMLAGKLPFVAADARGLLYQHVAEKPKPLPDDVPAPLVEVVMRLLAKNPEERYPTATAAIAALVAASRTMPPDRWAWVPLLTKTTPSAEPPVVDPRGARTGDTIVSPDADSVGDDGPAARPKLLTDPDATPPPAHTRPPSERSGFTVLSPDERPAAPPVQPELERMGEVLDEILNDNVAGADVLQDEIFEQPPGGWHFKQLDTGVGIVSKAARPSGSTPEPSGTTAPGGTAPGTTAPGGTAPGTSKPAVLPPPPRVSPASGLPAAPPAGAAPKADDGPRSLTPLFSDTGFGLEEKVGRPEPKDD